MYLRLFDGIRAVSAFTAGGTLEVRGWAATKPAWADLSAPWPPAPAPSCQVIDTHYDDAGCGMIEPNDNHPVCTVTIMLLAKSAP